MKSQIKLIAALVVALTGQILTAKADLIADRITVTVRGSGPDVLLIPGLATSSKVWDATVSQLENHFRLHVIQVAGFAGSAPRANAQGPVIQPTVDAIDAYIKANKLHAPKIIGHSLGGLMAQMLAIQHPEDVGGLLIVDSLPFYGALFGVKDVSEVTPQAGAMRDSILAETQADYTKGEKQFIRTLVKSPEGQRLVTGWAVASDKSVVARAMYEDMTTDLRAGLPTIKTSVTVLYPWDPQSGFPREATDKLYREIFAALPNAKVLCIEESFHFIMLDQPDKFFAQVDAFLK